MARLMLCAALAVTLGIAHPQRALADEAPDAVGSNDADESFRAGRALLRDKRYADACPKFEESQRQDPASGTLLALAYCQELSGQLATSWTSYLAAAQLAEREGHDDRRAAAIERAQALAQRCSKLTVVVPAELLSWPGFHVLRDGVEFERASFGIAVPTDGGSHVFQATAPGRVAWSSTVTLLAEQDQKTLVLPVLDLVPAQNVAPASTPRRVSSPVVADGKARDHELLLKRASLAFAVASAVGLGIGAGFALSAKSKNDDSNADGHCDSHGCDPRGTELRNSALSAARASTWSFVAGGALAACSITLYVTANSVRVAPSPSASLRGGALGAPGLNLSGSF